MNFHEERFPTTLSYGASGGPERRTQVVTLANGFEERNSPWQHSRRRYDAGLAVRSPDDVAAVIAFFEARHGMLYGFRWKDWADFKSCLPSQTPAATDQSLGAGDGTTTTFQLLKHYVSGAQDYARPVAKPIAGTVLVALDGVAQGLGSDFSVDTTTGVVSFASAPGSGVAVTAGFEYDVPVRFDTDHLQSSLATFEAGQLPDIPVVEVRV